MSEESLKDKTVKGVGWSAVDNVAQYAVTFVVGVVLARLLSPDEYGLIGVLTIFTTVCSAIINGGFSDFYNAHPRVEYSKSTFYCTGGLERDIVQYFQMKLIKILSNS